MERKSNKGIIFIYTNKHMHMNIQIYGRKPTKIEQNFKQINKQNLEKIKYKPIPHGKYSSKLDQN